MATEISAALIACLKLFNALLAEDHPEAFQEVPLRLWQDELGRLRVWSANIGAHQTGQSSLDYRLRDASHIKDQLVKLLEEYFRLLHEFDALLHNHDSGQTVQEGDFFDDEFASDNDNETELQNIYGTLVRTMGSLFKMSMIIRHPAQHDRLLNSRREDTSYFEQNDRSHVMEKFPHANIAIIDRLGVAISKRRGYLKYRERHHQKLSRDLDLALDGAGEAKSTAMSSTVASELDEIHLDMTDSNSESGMAGTSVADSLFEKGKPITIPPPPRASANGEFECPYCYIIIAIRDRIDWARHIFRDILPYVCIFPDCHSSNRLYATRREWSKHVRDQHISLVSATEPATKCPLCSDDTQGMTEMGLQKHVGRHLEDLALFALPRGDPEDLEEEEEENSDLERAVEASASSNNSIADEEDHGEQNKSMDKEAFIQISAEGRQLEIDEALESQTLAQEAVPAQVANTVSEGTLADGTKPKPSPFKSRYENPSTRATWRWEMVTSYKLRRKPLQDYLRSKFGNYDFYISMTDDMWKFWIPRPLTEEERWQIRALADKDYAESSTRRSETSSTDD